MFNYYNFGAYDENGCARFSVFFPGPQDYSRGGDPKIKELKVFGSFQTAFGQSAWSEENAIQLKPGAFEGGTLYQATTCNGSRLKGVGLAFDAVLGSN